MRIRSTRQTFLIAAMLSAAVPPTSTAQGDLVQLPGWVGAQRFRIITNVTPRPDRYILMDFANPLPGRETEFERSENQIIERALRLPGWMAAQRFRLVDTPGRPSAKPKELTLWETEGTSAQAVQDTLSSAQKSGLIQKNAATDQGTAEMVYWEPITPYITKNDFMR
jgi:hypothetical protein